MIPLTAAETRRLFNLYTRVAHPHAATVHPCPALRANGEAWKSAHDARNAS